MMNNKQLKSIAAAVALMFLLAGTSGCYFSIVSIDNLAPSPDQVTVKPFPKITSATALVTIVSEDEKGHYYEDCWWDPWWGWLCDWFYIWDRTDVIIDIKLTVKVEDVAQDLGNPDIPAWIQVLDTEHQGQPTKSMCLLNISTEEKPITSANIISGTVNKVVNVTIKNVRFAFERGGCTTFSANIPIRITAKEEGVMIESNVNKDAAVLIKR